MNELRPKLFDVLKGYTKEQAIKDIISGIIVAIIALPLSIALAIASGVGPEQGLYTAIIAGFFISFFGGSRVQIGGPTAAFVVIIYGIVQSYGTDGLVVATIMAGIILVIMGICHFGSLIKYIPYTITPNLSYDHTRQTKCQKVCRIKEIWQITHLLSPFSIVTGNEENCNPCSKGIDTKIYQI